jgi:hypothetical protein
MDPRALRSPGRGFHRPGSSHAIKGAMATGSESRKMRQWRVPYNNNSNIPRMRQALPRRPESPLSRDATDPTLPGDEAHGCAEWHGKAGKSKRENAEA